MSYILYITGNCDSHTSWKCDHMKLENVIPVPLEPLVNVIPIPQENYLETQHNT